MYEPKLKKYFFFLFIPILNINTLFLYLYDNIKKNGFDFGSTFRGKQHTTESKNKIGKSNSLKQKGNKNSQYGTCWITNEINNKKIYKGDLIPKGWRLGRIMKKNK